MFNIACMHAMYDVFLRKKYPSLSLGIFFGSVLVNDFWTPHPPLPQNCAKVKNVGKLTKCSNSDLRAKLGLIFNLGLVNSHYA